MLRLQGVESGLNTASGGGGARMGLLKEKRGDCGEIGEELVSFFWEGASGLQDESWDNGLGKGPGCSQVQECQSDHWPLWLEPDVSCERWERVSIKPRAIKPARITESWTVQWVGKLA